MAVDFFLPTVGVTRVSFNAGDNDADDLNDRFGTVKIDLELTREDELVND